jgi:hypothetical protein
VVVNEFLPATPVYRQSAGHGGIAGCTARSDAEQLDR